MASNLTVYGGFSARPAYRIMLYVRRDITDWANNRSSYAWELRAEKVSSGTTWTANPQTWNVQVGSDNWTGSHSLDFRSTNSITLSSNTTNYFNHDGNGNLNITIAANVLASGDSLFGNAYASGTFSVDRIAKAPAAPTMQGTTGITTSQYTLNFYGNDDGGAAIQGWQIQWATNAGFTADVGIGTNAANNGITTVLSRNDNTTYYNRVRGWNNASGGVTYGTWGSTVVATTLSAATVPPAPIPGSITGKTYNAFGFNFSSGGTGGSAITAWEVQRSLSGSFTSPTTTTNGPTDFNVGYTGLSGDTTYYVRVRGVNAVGNGAWSSTTSTTTDPTPTAPAAPTIDSITDIGPSSLRVNWHGNSNGGSPVTSWLMQIDDNVGFSSPTTFSPSSFANVISSLNDGEQYWVRVRATNAFGTSAYSNVATATTLAAVLVGKSGDFEYTTVYVGKAGGWVVAEVFVGAGGSFILPT